MLEGLKNLLNRGRSSNPKAEKLEGPDEFDFSAALNWMEKENTQVFGPPDVRAAKNKEYVDGLLAEHGEKILRQISIALSTQNDFIPADSCQRAIDPETPLESIFHKASYPFFYFEGCERTDEGYSVRVAHGVNMAARGEIFLLKGDDTDLQVISRHQTWIS